MLVLHAATIASSNILPSISNQNAAEKANQKLWKILDQQLYDIGFTNMVDYMEEVKKFLVVMKCSHSRSKWLWNEAEWNLKLPTTVTFIDSASIMHYQFATRTVEESWCRNYPIAGSNTHTCMNGHGFDPDIMDTPSSSCVVRHSNAANGGRGVFATKPIAEGSTVALGSCVQGIVVPSSTLQHLIAGSFKMEKTHVSDFWDVVYFGFIEGYGWFENEFASLFCCVFVLSFLFH